VVKVIDHQKPVYGIAFLGEELFVVSGNSSPGGVDVYSSITFDHLRNIDIPDSQCLWSIVASPLINCLYISDPGLKVLHRHHLVSNNTTQLRTETECLGLSLTKEGNIVFVSPSAKRIQEHSLDGVLNNIINIDGSIECPQHCIQLSSEQYVISHTGTQCRVCIVGTNENIIKSYGECEGAKLGQMNSPGRMVIDKYNNILVADEKNNRIELLNSKLSNRGYIQIPADGYQLKGPRALSFDKQNKRLYIGDNNNLVVLSGNVQ